MKGLGALLAILLAAGAARALECPEGCPESLASFLAGRGYVEVELSENTTGQFEVEATLDGERLLLLVDSGSSHTLFSRARLEELGMELEETRIEFSGFGSTQRLQSAQTEDLVIGGASTGPISVFAADLEHLRSRLEQAGSRPVDGVLGADFLGRWSAVLQVKRSKLFLRIR